MNLSSLIQALLYPFKQILFYHKKKLAFFILTLLIFAVVLFPYSDLTLFSQQKINQQLQASGGQVNYSEINFNFPLGFKTRDFELNTPTFKKPLKADLVSARLNVLPLLRLRPGGNLKFSGLFSGDVNVDGSLTGKTAENKRKFEVQIDLARLSLDEILKFQNINYPIKGSLNGSAQAEGEESFRRQPAGEFKFNLRNVLIPSELNLPIGTLELPSKINWENSNLFGKFENGRVQIKDGTLGTKEAPVNGRYKGYIECSFNRSGSNLRALCTNYDLQVELELDSQFQRNIAQDLSSFIKPNQVKQERLASGGAKYLFGIKGNAANRYSSPRLYRINSFQ